MAVLIPAPGSCVSRMTSGERRQAERLEQKLEDDYLQWYDVPRNLCAQALDQRKLPVEKCLSAGDFDPNSDKIKVMTMKVSKGLEFPVALPDVVHMPADSQQAQSAAAQK